MNKLLCSVLTLAFVGVSSVASAQETTPNNHQVRVGFGADLGVPSGIGVGLIVHPAVDWLSLDVSFQENILSPGGRASVRLDPLAVLPRLPFGVFIDGQYGIFGRGVIPGKSSNLPSIGYQYVNTYLGLRFGRANGFYWFIEGGPSYLDINSSGFSNLVSKSNGFSVGNPTVTGWITPTALTGFSVVWP